MSRLHNVSYCEEKTDEDDDDDADDDKYDGERYLKKRKSMTQQMRREIDTECNKWWKIVGGKDSNCVYMEAMKPCCDDIKHCECTKRVIFLLQVYVKWCERYMYYVSLNELIDKICGKSYFYKSYHQRDFDKLLLMNDYIHIIDKHLKMNIGESDQDNVCTNYSLNWKYLTKELGICENNSCKIFKRHFRNKNICITSYKQRAKKYFGYLSSDKIELIQLFDQIHCHITHCNPFVIHSLYDSIFDIYIKGNAVDSEECDHKEDEYNNCASLKHSDDEYDSYIEMSDDDDHVVNSEEASTNTEKQRQNKLKQKINRERLII